MNPQNKKPASGHKASKILNVVTASLSVIGKSLDIPDSRRSTARYTQEFTKHCESRGLLDALKVYKYLYDCVKSKSLGLRIPPQSGYLWLSTDREGFPSKAKAILEASQLDLSLPNHARFALSVFSLYELLKVPNPKVDLTTLTQPQSSEWLLTTTRTFVHFIGRHRSVLDKIKTETVPKVADYFSLKGGPFGPSTPSWTADFVALISNAPVLAEVVKIERLFGFDQASSLNNLNKEMSLDFSKEGILPSSKPLPLLVTFAIPDKGPKVRIATKGNYYLQRCLKPMHDHLMRILKRIPEDGTYRQATTAKTAKQLTKRGQTPWCFDLTAATDRMPVDVQYLVLQGLKLPYADAWFKIMSKCWSLNEDTNELFQFEVGQPMGLYSSWPVFTLSHHMIVRYAFYLAQISYKNQYCIIGDDILIASEDAAKIYRQLMLGLGVKISPTKSITPENISGNYSIAEIAKRLFRDGVELSPVRPNMLRALRADNYGWAGLKNAWFEIDSRWGAQVSVKMLISDPHTACAPAAAPIEKLIPKGAKRQLAGLFLPSPVGGRRIHLFARLEAGNEDMNIANKLPVLVVREVCWTNWSNEFITRAAKVVRDFELDLYTQSISDVKETLHILGSLSGTDHIALGNVKDYKSLHQALWRSSSANPIYHALSTVKTQLDEMTKDIMSFMTGDADEIVSDLHMLSINLRKIETWFKSGFSKDIVSKKDDIARQSGKYMIDLKKMCEDESLVARAICWRTLPDPSETTEVDLIAQSLPRNERTVRILGLPRSER